MSTLQDGFRLSNLSRRELVRRAGLLGGAALLAPHVGDKSGAEAVAIRQGTPGKLTFLSEETDPDTVRVTDQIIADFQASHPGVEVEAEYLNFDEAYARLQQLIGAGEPPDLAKFDNNQVARFAVEGLVEPVTDIIGQMGGVPENVRLMIDGEDYFVPNELNLWMLFYRKDLFERAGLKPPQRWDDYVAVSEKLTDPQNNQFGNLLLTNPASTYTSSEVLNHFWSNGANLFAWDGEAWQVALDEEPNLSAAAEALEWMARRMQFSPPTTNYSWSDVNQAYGSGRIAMVEYVGARTLNYLTTEAPDLEPLTGVVALPYNKEPRRQATAGGYCVFKKEGRDPTLAKQLGLAMVTGESYLDWLWTVPGHLVPPSQDLFAGRWREHPYLQGRPDLLPVIEDARKTSYTSIRGPEGEQLNIVSGALWATEIYGTMISDVALEKKDPTESVKRAAEEMREFAKTLQRFGG